MNNPECGICLINEGLSDLHLAFRVSINRSFSWSEYGIQKSISLALFLSLGGLASLKKRFILANDNIK